MENFLPRPSMGGLLDELLEGERLLKTKPLFNTSAYTLFEGQQR